MLLKDYLLKNGIKAKEFGESINLSKPHMYAILRGARKPSLELAVLIEEITSSEVRPKDFCNSLSKQ